jgi:hypothetical protein
VVIRALESACRRLFLSAMTYSRNGAVVASRLASRQCDAIDANEEAVQCSGPLEACLPALGFVPVDDTRGQGFLLDLIEPHDPPSKRVGSQEYMAIRSDCYSSCSPS